MAIHFHLFSGVWPTTLNCREDQQEEREEVTRPYPLKTLKPECLEYTESQLQEHLQLLDTPRAEAGYWTQRSVVEAMNCLEVQHLSFIPVNPQVAQILYMKRTGTDPDISESVVYPFHYSKYRFILAVQTAHKIFLLKQLSLEQTLHDLELDDTAGIAKILISFENDPKTTGIALTILNRSHLSRTYLWLK